MSPKNHREHSRNALIWIKSRIGATAPGGIHANRPYMRRLAPAAALLVIAIFLHCGSASAQQQVKIAVFDFENTGGPDASWLGPCLSNYVIGAINTAPGARAYSRGEVRRQLELIESPIPARVAFERKDAALGALGGDTFIEGAFSVNKNKFNFRGSLITPAKNVVKDISFSVPDFSLEKVQAQLASRTGAALGKKLKPNQRAIWNTSNKTAYTQYWQAVRLFETSKPDQALGALEKSAAADKTFVEPRILAARINMEKTLFSAAVEQLEKCLQIAPKNPEISYQLGLAYFLLHKNSEAKTYLKAAAAISPQNAEYRWQLGALYKNTFQLDKAVEELTKAVKLAPGMAQAWYDLASIYALAGSRDNAMDCIEKALKYARSAFISKVRNDSDFDTLRGEKRFKEIMRHYQ